MKFHVNTMIAINVLIIVVCFLQNLHIALPLAVKLLKLRAWMVKQVPALVYQQKNVVHKQLFVIV